MLSRLSSAVYIRNLSTLFTPSPVERMEGRSIQSDDTTQASSPFFFSLRLSLLSLSSRRRVLTEEEEESSYLHLRRTICLSISD